MENDVDITKLKYVLYARKSTDDPKRQSTSIEDQVAACETMAANWGIKLVRPYIREEKSAKTPGKRPQFSQLIEDLKAGKYDGIVAWHPDRLARNMKEGGEIINMLDEGDIVDLKFCTHHFTPDPSGIMLLGMAFVLSKEYSDRLSANVTRGVRRRLNEGKSGGTYKPGYVLNEDIYYEPDPDNFSIVEQAWKDRINGLPYSEIVTRMNASGFTRTYKGDKTKASKMSVQKLTKLFRDPIYYGYLVQSGETINLLDKYDFKPMVSFEQFSDVQAMTRSKVPNATRKRHTFFPLKQMVLCDTCGRKMYAGAPTSRSGTRYLYYECQNKDCSRSPKRIRAKVIFNWIYDFLETGLNFTEEDYKKLEDRLVKLSEGKKNALKTETNSIRATVSKNDRRMREIAIGLPKLDKNSKAWEINMEEITKLEAENDKLGEEADKKQEQLDISKGLVITLEDFLNLSKTASSKVKAGDEVQKDNILRKIFWNLTVNEKEVVTYLCKEPFATLLKDKSILNGRLVATLNEPMSKTVYTRFCETIRLLRTSWKDCNAYSITS